MLILHVWAKSPITLRCLCQSGVETLFPDSEERNIIEKNTLKLKMFVVKIYSDLMKEILIKESMKFLYI